MKIHGFPKQERIVSLKLIDELFNSGQSHSLTAFPLRAVYLVRNSPCKSEATKNSPCESVATKNSPCESVVKEDSPSIQLLLSVPKRRFKHAVDRNRVKRQLREAFRKNKALLTEAIAEGSSVALAFIWMSDQHLPSADVEQRVVSLLKRIAGTINNN